MSTSAELGGFVRVEDSEDGIGRVVEIVGSTARVEYFVSPVGPRLELRTVPCRTLEPLKLPAQTVIYWRDPEHSVWRTGRVDGGLIAARAIDAREDHYHIRFPNLVERRIPVSEVFVRWEHPLEDPTELLEAQTTETPYFAAARLGFLRHLSAQATAFQGMTGLAAAAIEYHPHQLAVVRRVLSDPIQRYLLADEVGLGKTIEAGILLRQHLLDEPTAQALVLVPTHLVDQWRDELVRKFSIEVTGTSPQDEEDDGEGRVVIAAHEALDQRFLRGLKPTTLLIVDEAHHVARWAWSAEPQQHERFRLLDKLAQQAPSVFLLSGTPLHQEEDGFLAMLHLLDPSGYPLDDRESFRLRVQNRQVVADSLADLTDDADPLFVAEALARLESGFQSDRTLQSLCERLRAVADGDTEDPLRAAAIRNVRAHLGESYRLHRRLLRTRREHPHVAPLLPKRNGIEWLQGNDQSREVAEGFLEEWRRELPASSLAAQSSDTKLCALWVDSVLSHPSVLLRRISQRKALLLREPVDDASPEEHLLLGLTPAFPGEVDLLTRWKSELETSLVEEPRAKALADWLRRQPPKGQRALVFVDDEEVAVRVAKCLMAELGAAKVARHSAYDPGPARRFIDRKLDVLVCDRNGEEGLNLQGVPAAVVLYDLPLDAARLEQRLGRVDRIEGLAKLRLLGFQGAGPLEVAWQRCLGEAIGVFRRSVAPLQYPLTETARRIRSAYALDGSAAIDAETARLCDPKSGLEAELRRIRSQEALDSLDWDAEEEEAFAAGVQDARVDAKSTGPEAFGGWMERCLNFERRGHDPFHYVHRLGGKRPTLVPLGDTLVRFSQWFSTQEKRRPDELPLGPFSFDAEASHDSGAHLLRVGHPFVDALENMVRSDGRGTSWVFWRHAPDLELELPRLFFGFQFIVEADLAKAHALVDTLRGSSHALHRQASSVFPPRVVSLWVGPDGEQVSDPALLAALTAPYKSRAYSDVHVRAERWLRVEEMAPVGDWALRCQGARAAAERLLRSHTDFVTQSRRSVDLLQATLDSSAAILRARAARLSGPSREAEEKAMVHAQRLASALVHGTENPRIVVDSAGAIFLSPNPWGAGEQPSVSPSPSAYSRL